MEISASYRPITLATGKSADTTPPAPDTAPKPAPPKDRIELSVAALRTARTWPASEGVSADPTLRVIQSALASVSGAEVTVTGVAAVGADGEGDPGALVAGYQEGTVNTEAVSLAVGGTISTKDGKDLGFTLDLRYDQLSYAAQAAAVQVGADGVSVQFSGIAAELTSTSFNFTMASAGDSGPVTGRGSLHLNDEVSRVGKELKPLAKAFMSTAGLRGGWGEINRFLRSATRQRLL